MIVRLIGIAAQVMLALLVAFSIEQGWSRSETDFPNYYTAAKLVLKGEPLRNYYDWPYFQRQMNYAGIEHQLGGYIPQTPLTMMPLLPVAMLSPQQAKRIWLVGNLVFLAATLWLLGRITRFTLSQLVLLVLAGYGSLHVNFLLGQYYVFLLFLLTLAFYQIHRKHGGSAGVLFGMAFGLKLYGAPFLAYFAVKRHGKAAAAMVATLIGLVMVAVIVFGWRDIVYYAVHILPRSMQGETLDPYNPGNGSLGTLLRRTLIDEPELNPNPLFNAPGLFFFLQPLLTLIILGVPLLAIWRMPVTTRDAAWYLIAVLLASPNTASYTFILLLLPVAVLLMEARGNQRILLIVCYALLTIPMRPSWSWLFPKVWLLVILFVAAGRPYWSRVRMKSLLTGLGIVIIAAWGLSGWNMVGYSREPGRRWERIALQPGAIYSSSPAVIRSGTLYESIGTGKYVLRWLHNGRIDLLPFPGEAFHPVALAPDGPVEFELVAHGASTLVTFQPGTTDGVSQRSVIRGYVEEPVTSPDGRWQTFTSTDGAAKQVWLRRVGDAASMPLTGGNCNSFGPTWELNSAAVIFASDCGRGIGLTALYRARVGGH